MSNFDVNRIKYLYAVCDESDYNARFEYVSKWNEDVSHREFVECTCDFKSPFFALNYNEKLLNRYYKWNKEISKPIVVMISSEAVADIDVKCFMHYHSLNNSECPFEDMFKETQVFFCDGEKYVKTRKNLNKKYDETTDDWAEIELPDYFKVESKHIIGYKKLDENDFFNCSYCNIALNPEWDLYRERKYFIGDSNDNNISDMVYHKDFEYGIITNSVYRGSELYYEIIFCENKKTRLIHYSKIYNCFLNEEYTGKNAFCLKQSTSIDWHKYYRAICAFCLDFKPDIEYEDYFDDYDTDIEEEEPIDDYHNQMIENIKKTDSEFYDILKERRFDDMLEESKRRKGE